MPDPAPETDRELLDRLLPRWRIVPTHSGVYVFSTIFRSHDFVTESMAVADAARSLRAILARDRETRGEAKAESGQRIIAGLTELRDQAAGGTIPSRPVRVPVQLTNYEHGGKRYFVAIDNEGNMWHTHNIIYGGWAGLKSLPQPGEDGGE